MMALHSIRRGGWLLTAAALLSSCLYAQSGTMSAADLAHRVDDHYNHLHSLKTGFVESYEGMGLHRNESGTLLLAKPGRMRWNYSSPMGKIFLLDGKFAYFYAPGDPHVQRIPAKQLDDLRSPLRFLLGHTELQKELSHLAVAPAENGQFILTGQPKGQEKRVSRVSITVTPDGVITKLEIEETDGAVTRFDFSGELANPPLPMGEFHFTPPPGVPVVDSLPPV